jgi:hypothetical protein
MVDITSLLVTINWGKIPKQQQSQQFFCHLQCFISKMHPNVPIYLENIALSDTETNP